MIVNLYQDNYSGYRQHGVSGVGGSNPLAPTKKKHKNQDVTAVFIPISERGSNGELRRNNPVKYFLKARRNLHAGLFL